jgi:hypothetical protein
MPELYDVVVLRDSQRGSGHGAISLVKGIEKGGGAVSSIVTVTVISATQVECHLTVSCLFPPSFVFGLPW